MNYSNLFDDTNVSKKYDRKVIMYFNSIGSINKMYVYDFEPGDIFTIDEEIESD